VNRLTRSISFTSACLYELSFLGVALVWAFAFREPVFSRVYWNKADFAAGLVAVIPLFLFLAWLMKSRLETVVQHRKLVHSLFRPLIGEWSILQLAALSLCAGIAEEIFFRGAIQADLAGRIGFKLALVLSSIAFGAAHPVTWTYSIIATLMGAYLGGLFIWTGNLLGPIVAHAVYDFGALVYLQRADTNSPADS
jgi:uncharacterized protein